MCNLGNRAHLSCHSRWAQHPNNVTLCLVSAITQLFQPCFSPPTFREPKWFESIKRWIHNWFLRLCHIFVHFWGKKKKNIVWFCVYFFVNLKKITKKNDIFQSLSGFGHAFLNFFYFNFNVISFPLMGGSTFLFSPTHSEHILLCMSCDVWTLL